MPADKVKLVVNGKEYRDWLEVDLDSDVFTPADSFLVKARHPGRSLIGAFREGMSLEVYVDDDRQMAGMLDEVRQSFTRKQSTLELAGRDKGAFLVDVDTEKVSAKNYTLKTLAEKLLKPSFGIRRVIVSNEQNRKLLLGKKDRGGKAGTSKRGGPLFTDSPRAKTHVDAGQRVAQILDQHCRRLGVTWWLTAEGDLFLGKPNYNQDVAYKFLSFSAGSSKAKYNNLETCNVVASISDRYSELQVVGQGGSSSSLFSAPTSVKESRFKAKAIDEDLVKRGIERRLIVRDSDTLNHAQCQARADYEMGKRRLAGLVLKVTVAGWRQEGRLYATDTLASVQIEEAAIEGVFWISQRRFTESRAKKRTQLTLVRKGVWLA